MFASRLTVAALCVGLFAREAAADLTDTARFLAGKSASSEPHAGTESYVEYGYVIRSGWKQFQQPNLEKMRGWWRGRGPATYSTVFYPFSGPDLGNALALFPDADTYLMFGLEAPGDLPEIQPMEGVAVTAGLSELKASLSDMMQVNYFFTRAMKKKLGNGSFNTVSGLLLFFLGMSDCDVTSARRIAIRDGRLVTGTADDRIPGIEITFRRQRGKVQTIRYFMTNVADAELTKHPDFLAYLEGQGRFATMIKSASYLMHGNQFDRIRARILAQSDFLVQDDSAIPLRLFARSSWTLRFHGRYEAPTQEFIKHLQKDLRVEMQRNSTGKLPFSYGYAYKQRESNLMTAERAR